MIQDLRKLLGHSVVYSLGDFGTKIIAFLLVPIYTRVLAAADYGILATLGATASILSILYGLGLKGAITRLYFDYQDGERYRDYLGSMWLLITGLALVTTIFLVYLGQGLLNHLFKSIPFDPYLRIVIWTTFFSVSSTLPMVLFRAREESLKFSLFTISQFGISLAITLYLVVYLRQGALGKVKADWYTAIIFFAIFSVVTWRNIRLHFAWSHVKESLAFGLPLVPHSLANWVLDLSDRLFLERFGTLDDLGLYSLGYSLASIMAILTGAVNMAWVPYFLAEGGQKEQQPKIARLVTYFVFLFVFAGLALSLFSREILIVMTIPRFYGAAQFLPPLAATYILHGLYLIAVNGIFLTKQTGYLPLLTSVTALINLVLNFLLIPPFGAMGAVSATLLSYAVRFGIVFAVSMRLYPLTYEYVRLGKVFLAAGSAWVISFFLPESDLWISLGVKTLLLVSFFAILYIARFYSAEELRTLGRVRTIITARLMQKRKV